MAGKQNKVVTLIITSLILLFILVVLPVGSWYYLKEGLDYRMTKIGELKQYGTLPDFSYTTLWNKPITAADIKDKVVVANVLDLQNGEMSRSFGQILEKLHIQFDERKDVCFLIHVLDTVGVNAENFARKYQLEDATQCYFIPTLATDLKHLASDYHLSADSLYVAPAKKGRDYPTEGAGKIMINLIIIFPGF